MSSARFGRHQRLLSAPDFKRVFADSRKCASRYLTLLYRPNGLDHARLGLAIPKRQVRQAVARNRLRRLVRESFRQHQGHLPGVDVVVLARVGVERLSNRAVFDTLDRMWQDLSKSCASSSSS